MIPVNACFFDLDETLIKDRASTGHSLDRVIPILLERHPHLDEAVVRRTYVTNNTWHWENFDKSPIAAIEDPAETRAFLWKLVLAALEIEDDSLANDLGLAYQDARHESFAPYEDVAEWLEGFRAIGPMVLVTNGNTLMQREKLRRCGLEEGWDAIFIAQEQGVSKPDAEIFKRALDRFGLNAEECVMVGDNLNTDIQGGINAGLQTCWMRRDPEAQPSAEVQPDFTVSGLQELYMRVRGRHD